MADMDTDFDTEEPGTILPGQGDYESNPHSSTGDNAMYDEVTAASVNKAYRERKYKAKAIVLGNPRLSQNMVIKVNNVGLKYSGRWWVKEVSHKFDESRGYYCELDLQRDAIGTPDEDTTGRSDGTVTENKKDTDTSDTNDTTTTPNDGRKEEEVEVNGIYGSTKEVTR